MAVYGDRDIVVKVDFFTWETMPESLKEIALKQGFVPPKENEIIAVKTIIITYIRRTPFILHKNIIDIFVFHQICTFFNSIFLPQNGQ